MTSQSVDSAKTRLARPESHAGVVDSGFEQRLIEGIRPIAEHFLAAALHHFFDTGIYDNLRAGTDYWPIAELAQKMDFEEYRLRGLLHFLANEGVVDITGDAVKLTEKGAGYGEFRPWYTMLIGGYSRTLGEMGAALRRGAPNCTRDGRYVSMGSCEMSRYDGMPITKALIDRANVQCRQVLDLGCGSALYLTEFCEQLPGITAWGCEPDPGGYAEAVEAVTAASMSHRISLANQSATEFMAAPPPECEPDLIVIGYVLQEVLQQEGEEAVETLLRNSVTRFPRSSIAVIEVANEVDNPAVMRHGLATNFWNPYFLLHTFTEQRLEREEYWERMFERLGLRIDAFVSTDQHVDSTGLELGYLLRAADRS